MIENLKPQFNNGYDVLTIWEQDFKTDPNETIQKCVNYLMK